MKVEVLMEKAYAALKDLDLSPAGEKLAVQVNLTGKNSGVFYIEILNGRLAVEPYDYHDHDFTLAAEGADLARLISGRMNTVNAIASGKLSVQGNMEKFSTLAAFFKAAAQAEKKKK